MEKLKEIIWERIGHASVCWDEKGVFDEIEANKAANAIWDAVKPLLEADKIVRRLAVLEDNWLSPMNLIHEARTYITTNPNKEGGDQNG